MADPSPAARAVLARYGHQPAPPAAEEVAEVLADLRECADDCTSASKHWWAGTMRRAAALLEQHHPAPVPAAERLPEPEDCDADGRCWLLTVEDGYPQWRLHSIDGNQPGGATMIWVPVDSFPGVMVDAFYTSHWLPAHALPLPAGIAAAALRAAAYQVAPVDSDGPWMWTDRDEMRSEILAIADELEEAER